MDIRSIVKSRKLKDKLRYCLSSMPDRPYLALYYYAMTGKVLHLKHPVGYNEKLQWLKLHDRHWEYTELVDKLAVRKHIKKVLGEEYLFPVLGHWKSFDDIDFNTLPDQFVLKCNHDSGSVKVISDKNSLTPDDIAEMREFFNVRLKRNFFLAGREYPYKNVKPYLFAEKYMGKSINDYKFFCFGGEPELLLVVSGRNTDDHSEDFFDMDFKRVHIVNGHHESKVTPEKPQFFEEMKELCRKLSQGMRQVRMDFYEIDGKIYFGEYTFFSGGGFELFHPDEWERKLGDLIKID